MQRFTLRKNARIRDFFDPHFREFGLSTEIYRVNLHTHSKCQEIWTRKTRNTDIFETVLPFQNE